MKLLVILFSFFFCLVSFAGDNCTPNKKTSSCLDKVVQERVQYACSLISAKGSQALPELRAMRYECCGEPNYVWVQDAKSKMVMHPLRPDLNGQDQMKFEDDNGKRIFPEFIKAAKAGGGWVHYVWKKFGESVATEKKSWVQKCQPSDKKEEWIVGSGTWL